MVCPTCLPGVPLRLLRYVGHVGNLRPRGTPPVRACTSPPNACPIIRKRTVVPSNAAWSVSRACSRCAFPHPSMAAFSRGRRRLGICVRRPQPRPCRSSARPPGRPPVTRVNFPQFRYREGDRSWGAGRRPVAHHQLKRVSAGHGRDKARAHGRSAAAP